MFTDGIVPAEYAWARPGPRREGEYPQALQRILWKHWLEIIEREKASGTGHIGPLGQIPSGSKPSPDRSDGP